MANRLAQALVRLLREPADPFFGGGAGDAIASQCVALRPEGAAPAREHVRGPVPHRAAETPARECRRRRRQEHHGREGCCDDDSHFPSSTADAEAGALASGLDESNSGRSLARPLLLRAGSRSAPALPQKRKSRSTP